MITVIGEALVDLVTGDCGADGSDLAIRARPGGGSYNTARTIGRLGVPVTFAGRLADDAFGRVLRAGLSESGVTIGVPRPTAAPTTLAMVNVGAGGGAEYRFYLDGTSAADLEYQDLLATLPASVNAVYLGGLWLVREPIATSISRLAARGLPADALLMVDPNCRPETIGSRREAYLGQLTRLTGRADILKASVDDLAYISPWQSPADAAAGLLAAGARLVLVTDGPRPARAFLPDDVVAVDVPAALVADTIGAGDAFGGAFLAWWTARECGRSGLADPAVVREALSFAVSVSALTCTRVGADPPLAAELPTHWRVSRS
jgi:fructokinase